MSDQTKQEVQSLLGCESVPVILLGKTVAKSAMLGGMMDSIEGTFEQAGVVDADLPPTLAILSKRLSGNGCAHRASDGAKMLAAAFCDTPAKAVMWAYTLCCMSAAKQAADPTASPAVRVLDIIDTFPEGVPGEDEYRTVWEAQKSPDAPLGNRLDDPATWARFAA